MDTDDIRQLLQLIDRTTAKGSRAAAIILLGFASALRRSELAALDLIDMEPKPGGLLLHVRRSKSDQDTAGQVLAVAHGQHVDTDRITALDAWLDCPGTGSLVRCSRACGTRPSPTSAFPATPSPASSAAAPSVLVCPAERITPHSLRAGHAPTAAIAGVSLDRIAAQTRHKRLSTLLGRYIRPAQALDLTSSRDLGAVAHAKSNGARLRAGDDVIGHGDAAERIGRGRGSSRLRTWRGEEHPWLAGTIGYPARRGFSGRFLASQTCTPNTS